MRAEARSNGHHGVYGRGAEVLSEWGAVRIPTCSCSSTRKCGVAVAGTLCSYYSRPGAP